MSTATVIAPEELVQAQLWRYATKKFDATRTIAPELWSALEQSLVLSPSSFGLQPWKFAVVSDPALRAKLRGVSWNQAQVEDASHLVVFLAKDSISEGDLDRLVERTAQVRQQAPEELAGLKGMMLGFLVNGPAAATIGQRTATPTVRAKIETQSTLCAAGKTPYALIRPLLGLIPTMLFSPAGTLPEPAVSVPNAKSTAPVATR